MLKKLKRRYFGELEVGSVEELPDGKVKLRYVNRPAYAPEEEILSKEEWEAGEKEEAITDPAKRREWFVGRTREMHKALLAVLQKYNPRYWDIPPALLRMQDGLSEAYKTAVSVAFGVVSFEDDVTMETVLKKVEDSGKDPLKDLNDFEKEVVSVIRKHSKKVHEFRNDVWASRITQAMKDGIDRSVMIALGKADIYLRTDDIEEWLKKGREIEEKKKD